MKKFTSYFESQLTEERIEGLVVVEKMYIITPSINSVPADLKKKILEVVDIDTFRKDRDFLYERFDLIDKSSLRVLKNITVSNNLEIGKSFIDISPIDNIKSLEHKLSEAKENGFVTVLVTDNRVSSDALDRMKMEGYLDYSI